MQTFAIPAILAAITTLSATPATAFSPAAWHSYPLARRGLHERHHPLSAALTPSWPAAAAWMDPWEVLARDSLWDDWPLADFGFDIPAVRQATSAARRLATKAATELSHELKAAKVAQTESGFTVTMDTAGYAPNELSVRVDDTVLHVSGEHVCEKGEDMCISRSFKRSWDLGSAKVDVPAIDVTRTPDGVMRVTLPKVATSCRKIPITHVDAPPAVEAGLPESLEASAEKDGSASTESERPAPIKHEL